MSLVIDHNNPSYRTRWNSANVNRFNGAFYYSKEIVKNIIPRVKTDRSWILVNTYGVAFDHSIVFIHNNKNPQNYKWLKGYKDLVLVCGVPETCDKVKHLGKAIYLPLSVDVEYVEQFKTKKTKEVAFIGRPAKRNNIDFSEPVDYIEGLPRTKLLKEMAKYKRIYAVGRCAIEGKILGCKIETYDPRFPDPSIWKVVDNKEAAKILQKELNKIDRR